MPVDGAALSLMPEASRLEQVGSSDAMTSGIEELQATVGEGPAIDAFESGAPILIPDLDALDGRWPAFADASATREQRAMFVFPLQLGAIRLGTLTLYRRDKGQLSPDTMADALRVADVIAMLLMGSKGDLVGDFAEQWLNESSWTREIHQATGILISQLGVGAEEAFVRLRAFAFAQDLSLSAVARSVVDGRVRLPALDGDG
jgi:hypothetical protein